MDSRLSLSPTSYGGVATELSKQETEQIIASIRRFFREELEVDLGELRARQVLDYFLKEVGPFAYNQGVKDAESYFRAKVEDLTAICFQDGLTYWLEKRKK